MRRSHARRLVPGVYCSQERNAHVGVLHELLGGLGRARQAARDAVGVVGVRQGVLLGERGRAHATDRGPIEESTTSAP